MATTRFYLDTRGVETGRPAPLKLAVTRMRKTALINLGVRLLPSQWDAAAGKVVSHPNKARLNTFITGRRLAVDNMLLRLAESGELARMDAAEIRDRALLELSPPSRNARNIHLRNIRTVFNETLDDGITSFYPSRRFKIRPEATPKRSLPVERLSALLGHPVEERRRKYLDIFKLIFLLAGINIIDLCNLKGITPEGRVEYRRAKVGRLYSIKVEPEALEIIDRYRRKGQLLDIIPKETIASALGHGGNAVTDIYIDFDRAKIDRANRIVIDWVLYGERRG